MPPSPHHLHLAASVVACCIVSVVVAVFQALRGGVGKDGTLGMPLGMTGDSAHILVVR